MKASSNPPTSSTLVRRATTVGFATCDLNSRARQNSLGEQDGGSNPNVPTTRPSGSTAWPPQEIKLMAGPESMVGSSGSHLFSKHSSSASQKTMYYLPASFTPT